MNVWALLGLMFWSFMFGFGVGGLVVAIQWARAGRRLQAKFNEIFDHVGEKAGP